MTSDQSKTDKGAEDPPGQSEEDSIFTEHWRDFVDAVECLYIQDNLSGRLKFREEWAYAAHLVLGSDLLQHDQEGTLEKEERVEQEEVAELRRMALVEIFETLEQDTIEDGDVKVSYVRDLIERLGRGIVEYIYKPAILEKIDPSDAPSSPAVANKKEESAPPPPSSQSSEAREDTLPVTLPVIPRPTPNEDKITVRQSEPSLSSPQAPADRKRLPKRRRSNVDPAPPLAELPSLQDDDLTSMVAEPKSEAPDDAKELPTVSVKKPAIFAPPKFQKPVVTKTLKEPGKEETPVETAPAAWEVKPNDSPAPVPDVTGAEGDETVNFEEDYGRELPEPGVQHPPMKASSRASDEEEDKDVDTSADFQSNTYSPDNAPTLKAIFNECATPSAA